MDRTELKDIHLAESISKKKKKKKLLNLNYNREGIPVIAISN